MATVAFLFLGEMLLIPHLFPIVEALSGRGVDLDLWVATTAHEALLAPWCAALDVQVRFRRAPGFARVAFHDAGWNPPLPPKLPMLLRLAPHLARARAVVCAEQTSLWLPRLLPLGTPFVKTSHGAGSMSARDDRRRRAARLMLVPSERERQTYLDRGFDPDRVRVTGYVKAGFRQRTCREVRFARRRPVILYTPHWRRWRSSWWAWGPQVVRRLAQDDRYNLIFAPHQRLAEQAPEVRDIAAEVAHRPNVHCDLDSFAMVDGSYTEAADIYLGDSSSQVLEFLVRPRPCVFLNPAGVAWAGDPDYAQWACGEVVAEFANLMPALERAIDRHPRFSDIQAAFARSSLGDTSDQAAKVAATEIMRLIEAPPRP
jgi:hypothetical protein